MFRFHESEREYRNGDNGPKYFIEGPRTNFGVVLLRTGDTIALHHHEIMEENFYVLEGAPTFTANGEEFDTKPGDFIHMEPGDVHSITNKQDEPCKFVIALGPSVEGGDKVAD